MVERTPFLERPDEVGLTLTVLGSSDGKCEHCDQRRILFFCHLFQERVVEDRCKDCAIQRAGGESAVFVKTGVKNIWDADKRGKAYNPSGRTSHVDDSSPQPVGERV